MFLRENLIIPKEDLDNTIRKVQEDGLSITKVSKQHGIPKETLRRWAKNGPNSSRVGSGRYTSVLSSSEEEMLVIALEESSRRGWAWWS